MEIVVGLENVAHAFGRPASISVSLLAVSSEIGRHIIGIIGLGHLSQPGTGDSMPSRIVVRCIRAGLDAHSAAA
jgi:hypothetical protein